MPEPLTKHARAANAPAPAPTRVVLATNPNHRGAALCCHHQRSDVATGHRVSHEQGPALPPVLGRVPCRPQRLIVLHRQYITPALLLQPPPQFPVIAVHRIPSYPAKGHVSRAAAPRPPPVPGAGRAPGPERPRRVGCHRPGTLRSDSSPPSPPRRCTAASSHRLFALLQKPRLIHHQHPSRVAQMLHHVPLQVVPHLASQWYTASNRCTPSAVASPASSANYHPFLRFTDPSNPCRYARNRNRSTLPSAGHRSTR